MTFGLCCLLALSRVPRLLSTCQTPRPPCSPVRAGHDGIETADCRILGASSAPRVVCQVVVHFWCRVFQLHQNEPLRRQLPQKQTCSAVLFLRMSDKTPQVDHKGTLLDAAGQRAASPIHPYGRASRVAASVFDHAVMLLAAWGVWSVRPGASSLRPGAPGCLERAPGCLEREPGCSESVFGCLESAPGCARVSEPAGWRSERAPGCLESLPGCARVSRGCAWVFRVCARVSPGV